MKNKKYIFLFIAFLFIFYFPSVSFAEEGSTTLLAPIMNIPIPTLTPLSNIEVVPGETASIPWIAQYIVAIYRYGLIIASMFTVIAFMISGIMYLTAGGLPQNIQKAKSISFGALTGVVLLVSSYLILNMINPNLTELKSLTIETFKTEKLPPYEDAGDTEDQIDSAAYSKPDIYCPQAGGKEAVPKIIASLKPVMYYRFGGKGNPPPYDKEYKPQFIKYKNFCPGICLDCSGFVNFVLKCAGLPAPGGGTSSIFGGAEKVNSFVLQGKNIIVNNAPLKFGDLVGWKAGESGKEIGHVLMYVDNGELAESHGGESGRKDGSFKQGLPNAEIQKAIRWVKRL